MTRKEIAQSCVRKIRVLYCNCATWFVEVLMPLDAVRAAAAVEDMAPAAWFGGDCTMGEKNPGLRGEAVGCGGMGRGPRALLAMSNSTGDTGLANTSLGS